MLYCHGFRIALDGRHRSEDMKLIPAIEAAHPGLSTVLRLQSRSLQPPTSSSATSATTPQCGRTGRRLFESCDVSVQSDGSLWYVDIPARGGATQARSLEEVESMAVDTSRSRRARTSWI